jgi:hypothetical protein
MFRSMNVLALLFVTTASGATIKPRFSWDTVMPFIHLSNTSGPFTDEAIAVLATFAMVTIEKFQGPCAAKSMPPTNTCGQEKLIIDTLRRVKQANSSVCTIFYYNSILNFPQYDLSARFMANNGSLCLHSTKGELIKSSGGHKNGMTVFDYTQQAACDLWASECINATATGFVDGCFADRAIDVQGFETNGDITTQKRAAFDKGHWDMLAKLQQAIGEGPVIANHAYNLTGVGAAMLEFAGANVETVTQLQASAQNKKIAQCHFSGLNDDRVATFLIGAGEYAYIGSGGWSISGTDISAVSNRWVPQYYERPLGTPLSDAVKTTNSATGSQTFTRRFSAGTNVTLVCDAGGGGGSANKESCKGTIEWAGPPVPTPPTPTPKPPTPKPAPTPLPAPTPPVQPTASCPVVHANCGFMHSDLGSTDANDWAACCADCKAHTNCDKWVWAERNAPKYCHLHSKDAGANTGGGICGEMRA